MYLRLQLFFFVSIEKQIIDEDKLWHSHGYGAISIWGEIHTLLNLSLCGNKLKVILSKLTTI